MNNRLAIAAVLATTAVAFGLHRPALAADEATPGAPPALSATAVDAAIRGQVEAALATEPSLRGVTILVDTRNGVVLLSGEVHNVAQYQAAERRAAQIEGVKGVTNELTVVEAG